MRLVRLTLAISHRGNVLRQRGVGAARKTLRGRRVAVMDEIGRNQSKYDKAEEGQLCERGDVSGGGGPELTCA